MTVTQATDLPDATVPESAIPADAPACPSPAAQARKFLAATIAGGIASFATRKGLTVTPAESSIITAVAAGAAAYIIPNAS